jgi:glycosyltransferase involved in cell wall biosynthesis
MVTFSVIVPTFNEEKTIENTLKALKNQTYKDFEIIVKDGGSTDTTIKIAKKYADKVVCRSDFSAADARNQGAEYAKGVFLVFVDADTELSEDMLERFASLLQNSTEIVGGSCRKIPQDGDVVDRIIYEFVNISTFFSYYLHIGGAHGSCMFIIKNVFKAINGFNPKIKIAEEQELVRKAKKFGKFVFLFDTCVFESSRRIRTWGKLRLYVTWLLGTFRSFKESKNQEYEKVR